MKENYSGKLRILLVFSVLFLAIVVLLALIFFEGKKTYTVQFDLDGGTLISGSLEQRITQGQDAVLPTVVKDGAFLRGWSSSHRRITRDITIKAIWEYETTAGIIYTENENQNFTEISGSYPHLYGEVYLGAYYNEKKVLGILDNAFAHRTGITKVYLLNGLISIGAGAFEGCTSLEEIEIPETVTRIEANAFRDCKALETLVLNEGLLEIGAGAFAGCENLKEVILPDSVTYINTDAFAGCYNLVIRTRIAEEDKPALWMEGWNGAAEVIWEDPSLLEDVEEDAANDEDKPRGRQ